MNSKALLKSAKKAKKDSAKLIRVAEKLLVDVRNTKGRYSL
jgi:hypothetical protein